MIDYIRSLEGHCLDKNSWSEFSKDQTQVFLHRYSFLEDQYSDFLTRIGGLEVYASKYILVLYGFALSEPELIYPVESYLRDKHYLAIGEYTEKRKENKWKGVGYFFSLSDKSPIVYTRFDQETDTEIVDRYFPTFLGFDELLKFVTKKPYEEQFSLATGGEYLPS